MVRLEAVRDDLGPALDGIQRKVHKDWLDRVIDMAESDATRIGGDLPVFGAGPLSNLNGPHYGGSCHRPLDRACLLRPTNVGLVHLKRAPVSLDRSGVGP